MKLLTLVLSMTLLSSAAFAGPLDHACVDADVKKQDLSLVMGILNKNGITYRVAKNTDGSYNVVAQARSGFGLNINSKLLKLSSLEILKEEGIDFNRTEEGRCFGNVQDVTQL